MGAYQTSSWDSRCHLIPDQLITTPALVGAQLLHSLVTLILLLNMPLSSAPSLMQGVTRSLAELKIIGAGPSRYPVDIHRCDLQWDQAWGSWPMCGKAGVFG